MAALEDPEGTDLQLWTCHGQNESEGLWWRVRRVEASSTRP